ncbi:MAG: RNA-guided pseudouridylation complex pseudouridine synthase subunit Cbf5 [Thermoplasmata archaeon]
MNMDGFIVLDKPQGPTSHQVDYWVKQLLGTDKVGHVGTLDPNVTGVLVMAVGKATKLIDVAHESPKEYVCVMRFYADISEEKVRDLFHMFTGKIYQLPPVRSAVARSMRIKEIYDLQMIEKRDRMVLFRVRCESGTYIRTLCTDIGYVAGTGAQMVDLRRTVTGPFVEDNAITLQELTAAVEIAKTGNDRILRSFILDVSYLFRNYPKVIAKKSSIKNISHGSDLYAGGVKAIIGSFIKGDRVCVLSEDNDVLGTGKAMCDSANMISKVVDFDRIIVGDQSGETDVVRNGEKIVPGPGHELHRNIQRNESRKNTENFRRRQDSRPERNAHYLRKNKDKGGIHRRSDHHQTRSFP